MYIHYESYVNQGLYNALSKDEFHKITDISNFRSKTEIQLILYLKL